MILLDINILTSPPSKWRDREGLGALPLPLETESHPEPYESLGGLTPDQFYDHTEVLSV